MNRVAKVALVTTVAFAAWELAWWARRRHRRAVVYEQALGAARALARPLVVIGAPDGGVTSGYGCGDVVVDIAGSQICPTVLAVDITASRSLPFADGSVVIACMCVLEYVSDASAALAEIQRVSGGYAFFVGVEPWTATAYLYPGAKRTLPASLR